MEGWIQLHRKIRENWLWRDPVKFQWWVDILMEANHKDNEVPIGFKVLQCKRGETIRSLQGWAKRWKVGKGVVKNFLAMLERQGMITLKNETVTTRLTICKYDSYQTNQNGNETRGNRKATARQPQAGTNNNDNNGNNGNNEKKEKRKDNAKPTSLHSKLQADWCKRYLSEVGLECDWRAAEGATLKSLITKLRNLAKQQHQKDNNTNPVTDEEIELFWQHFMSKMPEWYAEKADLKIINSKFNAIIAEIKKPEREAKKTVDALRDAFNF